MLFRFYHLDNPAKVILPDFSKIDSAQEAESKFDISVCHQVVLSLHYPAGQIVHSQRTSHERNRCNMQYKSRCTRIWKNSNDRIFSFYSWCRKNIVAVKPVIDVTTSCKAGSASVACDHGNKSINIVVIKVNKHNRRSLS